MPPRRVTEAPNELSDGLDVASPHGMLDILDACDEQMWTGVWDIPGVFDASVVGTRLCLLGPQVPRPWEPAKDLLVALAAAP